MSQASARLAPPPAATPLTAAITGFSSARILRIMGLNSVSIELPTSTLPSAPLVRSDREDRSAPAQKPRPVPVNMTQRTFASAAHLSTTSMISAIISSDMALSRSGRLRRMRPMPSATVNSSVVYDMAFSL